MQHNSASYQEWLEKVEEDEFAGQEILDGRRFAAPACFHFQQMAEKLLKAILIFYDIPFPKIHDLITLAGLLEPTTPEIKSYKSDLEFLSRYYVETRYPGDYPEFTLEECEKALASALRIKEFVLQKIKPSETNGGFGLLGIIIAVAVVAGIVGGGLYYYSSQLTTNNQQQVTPNDISTGGVKQTTRTQVRTETSGDSIDTSNWKTYRNEKYGFEVRYPIDWEFGYDNPSAPKRDDFTHINRIIDSTQSISFQVTPGRYSNIFTSFSNESVCYTFQRYQFRLDICDKSKVAEYGNYKSVDPRIIKAIVETIQFN